MKNNFSVIWK